MELGFGKRLERGESWWLEKWSSRWVMGVGCICVSMALCDAFPNLFSVAAHKDDVIR